jgi:hypothetical protein
MVETAGLVVIDWIRVRDVVRPMTGRQLMFGRVNVLARASTSQRNTAVVCRSKQDLLCVFEIPASFRTLS